MATEAVDADIDGDDLTTGFNPQFLLDGLTAIDGESSTSPSPRPPSRWSSPAPTPTTSTDSFRYLLMPRRLLG